MRDFLDTVIGIAKKSTDVLRRNMNERWSQCSQIRALSGECRNVAIGRQTRKLLSDNGMHCAILKTDEFF